MTKDTDHSVNYKEVSERPFPKPEGHLIYVSLEGPWFYINGEKNLKFKTRGNNELDLFNALARYNVDYWESDFRQCVNDMATQLQAQANAKHKVNEVKFEPGIFKPTDIQPFSFKGIAETE